MLSRIAVHEWDGFPIEHHLISTMTMAMTTTLIINIIIIIIRISIRRTAKAPALCIPGAASR